MYKKFKKVFLVMSIWGILFTNNYANEIKEVQLIDDFSAELLGETKNQEAEVPKPPVQQQTQEITEEKNIGEEQIEKSKDKDTEDKNENKPKEETVKNENSHKEDKVKKDEIKEAIEKASEKNNSVKEIKEVQEDKDLAIEEPENLIKDKQKYEMIKYYSADGVEWELPDNFRAVIVGDTKGNVIFAKDEINAGNISLSDSVRISKNPLKYGGSGIPLKAGQIFILEDLIKASAVYSANNATYAIAEYVGNGSVFGFVAKMNRKLKELGLQNEIRYHTPAGLPTRVTKQPMDEGTARGIYKLSIEALKYKKYIEIAGIKKTKIYNEKISIRNRNHLIGENGVYGIKTGFHKEAKYNIAVASKFEDTDVIIVVMGGETYKTRDGIVLSVLDILNNNYTVKNGLIKRK